LVPSTGGAWPGRGAPRCYRREKRRIEERREEEKRRREEKRREILIGAD